MKNKKVVKIQKVGNSFMVTIPKEFKEKMGFKVKDKAEVEYHAGTITIKPEKDEKEYNIQDLGKNAISIENFKEIPWSEMKEGFYER